MLKKTASAQLWPFARQCSGSFNGKPERVFFKKLINALVSTFALNYRCKTLFA